MKGKDRGELFQNSSFPEPIPQELRFVERPRNRSSFRSRGKLPILCASLFPLFLQKKEPTGLAGGSSYAPVRLCYQQRPNRRIANLASAFLLLAARKRATRVGKAKLRTQFILFQLFLYVIPNLLFVLAYRIHVVAPAPEFTIAVFELQIAKSFI